MPRAEKPGAATRHRHAFSHFIHFEQQGAVYANNPKSACTTVKTLFLAEQDLSPHMDVHQWAVRNLSLGLVDEQQARQIIGDSVLFTFVRHPLDRVLSAYRDKVKHFHWRMNKGPPPGRGRRENFRSARQRYRRMTRTLGLADSDLVSLDGFLHYLEILFKSKYADHQDQGIDRHFALQSINIGIKELQFDFIGRVESIDADVAQLSDQLGFQLTPPERLNKSNNTTRANPDQVRMIECLFEEDYRLLGY